MIFFTADNHFWHENIIKFCNRPFKSIEEMNEILIEKWNKKVSYSDTVIINGDFCLCNRTKFKKIHNTLNGTKIYLQGSHGNNVTKAIINSMVIDYGGHEIFIIHNPEDINCNYKLNFTAHVHDKWDIAYINRETIAINIGVDVWDYYPITIEEIMGKYAKWERGND